MNFFAGGKESIDHDHKLMDGNKKWMQINSTPYLLRYKTHLME